MFCLLHPGGCRGHAWAMNDLFATWHLPVNIDLGDDLDAVELLSRAHDRLVEIPELKDALRLLDIVRGEVSAWFDAGLAARADRARVGC